MKSNEANILADTVVILLEFSYGISIADSHTYETMASRLLKIQKVREWVYYHYLVLKESEIEDEKLVARIIEEKYFSNKDTENEQTRN